MKVGMLCLAALVLGCAAPTTSTQPAAPAAPAVSAAAASGIGPAAPIAASAPPGTAARSAVTPLDPPVSVHVGMAAVLPDAGLVLADENSYFRAVGLDVTWTQIASTPDMLPVLSTGELDVGFGGSTASFFNALSRGVPLKLVSGAKQSRAGVQSNCFIVRKDLVDSGAVRTVADWRGKRIGMQGFGVGTTSDLYLDLALKSGNLEQSDVEPSALGFPDTNAGLANKAIDIGWQAEPNITLGKEQGIFERGPCAGELFPGHYTNYIYYSPSFATKQDVARRFMYAYLQGTRDYLEAFFKNGPNRAEVVDVMARRTVLKDPNLWNRIAPYWADPDGRVDLQTLDFEQNWYREHGFSDRKVDLSAIVDTSFSAWAIQQLGPWQ